MPEDTSFEVPARADGFTPLFDQIVRELGTTAAVVYGVVWRHCQMRRGVCDATQGTMAQLTGLDDRTIRDWLPVLLREEYIVDVTPPERRGQSRVYVTTGKAELGMRLGAEERHKTPEPDLAPPASNAAPPASNAAPPRHLVPHPPALDADKDTIEETNQGNEEETSSSSPVAGSLEIRPREEEEEDPPGVARIIDSLGLPRHQAVDAYRIIDGGEGVGEKGTDAWIAFYHEHLEVMSPGGHFYTAVNKNRQRFPPSAYRSEPAQMTSDRLLEEVARKRKAQEERERAERWAKYGRHARPVEAESVL